MNVHQPSTAVERYNTTAQLFLALIAKERVIPHLVVFQHFMQQPIMAVLGVLAGAAAAKISYGGWAAGGILAYFSVLVGAKLTSNLVP